MDGIDPNIWSGGKFNSTPTDGQDSNKTGTFIMKLPFQTIRKVNVKRPNEYLDHECSNHCISESEETFLQTIKTAKLLADGMVMEGNPYLIPLMCGWSREFCPLTYIGPCGVKLSSPQELFKFLIKTNSKLSLDQFVFDPYTQLTNEDKIDEVYRIHWALILMI